MKSASWSNVAPGLAKLGNAEWPKSLRLLFQKGLTTPKIRPQQVIGCGCGRYMVSCATRLVRVECRALDS